MSNDLQSDLTADLLHDLARPVVAPGADGSTTQAPAADRAAARPARVGTPALSVTFTPLRWSRVSVRSAARWTGVAVHGGPWHVELAL